MILPNQKTAHAWRVATPDGAYVLETCFQPKHGGDVGGCDLRLLENTEVLLSLPMTQWNDPVGFFEGRFTFSLAYNGRRTAVRLDPARRTFVFQPTDAPEPLAVLPDRLQKMFGKPRAVGSLPRVDPAPAVDWTQSPPRGAIILNSTLALFNFTMGAVLTYLPSRFMHSAVISLANGGLEPAGTRHAMPPLPILLAGVIFFAGLLAQLLSLPRLFPQLSTR